MSAPPPENPAGVYQRHETFEQGVQSKLIGEIEQAPSRLRNTVDGLTDAQLDTAYRNWTVRQITHHLADSHLHSLIRFKWALTESNPTIKAYEEADWVELPDSRSGQVGPALAMLDGLHAKWVQLLNMMSEEQFSRTFFHPQSGETVDLWSALNYYAWHGKHHTAQIQWLRQQHAWTSQEQNS